MNQQEPSTRLRVDVTAKDMQQCSWFPSRQQRPIISSNNKRGHTGSIDEGELPPTQKLKGFVDDVGVVTPTYTLSPPSNNSDVMMFAIPFFNNSMGGVQNSSHPTNEDKKAAAAGASIEATSSMDYMDDEPVWGNMRDNKEPSAAATSSLQQPALRTRAVTADYLKRKVTADFDDDNSKQEDLSAGIYGWFTDDKDTMKLAGASLVSGGSSDDLNDEESKQSFLHPAVSHEDQEDDSSVINSRKFLHVLGDFDDGDINLDQPVFEDVILDPNTLDPSTDSLDDMFDFDEPTSPMPGTSSFLDEDLSSHSHLTTLDPLPFFPDECVTPVLKHPIENPPGKSFITPETAGQASNELGVMAKAIDMLADVADAALMADPMTAAYNFESSSGNEMMTAHQSREKREKEVKRSESAWRKKFDQLRDFARENGHCNVPQKYPANPSLGRWVARQRLFMRQCLDAQGEENGALPSSQMDIGERMKLLRTIGLQASPMKKGGSKKAPPGVFISCRNTKEWDNRFAELLRYKSIHGDCDVPVKSEGDFKSLGRWVTSQRKKYKDFHSGELGGDNSEQFLTRFQRLDEIGFKFKIGSGRGTGRLSASDKGKPKDS
eukprot:CAMPEP_0113404456 /NCGR_PEP_ID=MMETSP0013_2-20120614/18398_1 /TAXON_ID=2843 ORGANISM="Skeletonema costatum, Strain 1716" /NCGR_SAMPLE_ID=MMETSP0013_2 /ASSEMBLY_ACC=CAM_ASM_000158 /LENGTH=604 /DNA_ID=CAMNT_0000290057 /DNA_START=195 /DNA_END=2009 /DNA_ORIENTATION=+ /assembly_acc=CAM_ASM_000158